MLDPGERKIDSGSHVRITVLPFPYIGNIYALHSLMHNCQIGHPLVEKTSKEKFKMKSQ